MTTEQKDGEVNNADAPLLMDIARDMIGVVGMRHAALILDSLENAFLADKAAGVRDATETMRQRFAEKRAAAAGPHAGHPQGMHERY